MVVTIYHPITTYASTVSDPCPIPVISVYTSVKTPKHGVSWGNHREGVGKNDVMAVQQLAVNGEFITFGVV